jgi:hypothetical protein
MEIKPEYVTFEQAKLLKEKGFNVPTLAYRQKSARIGDETILPLALPDDEFQWGPFDWNNYSKEVPYYSIPEQWQVVEWLRIKHDIWVWVRPFKDHAADNNDPIQHQMNIFFKGVSISKEFNSHDEAYSAAFDYILKKMI